MRGSSYNTCAPSPRSSPRRHRCRSPGSGGTLLFAREWLGREQGHRHHQPRAADGRSWAAVAAMLEDPISQRGYVMQLLAAIRHSTWSRLPRLTMPVQVHHGTEDRIVPFAAGRELARRIPGARFEVHEGARHGILKRLDEVGERILGFLGEAEARAVRDPRTTTSSRAQVAHP